MRISHSKLTFSKISASIIAIALLLLMPEHMAHLLAAVAHIAYESMAFALETLLIHGLGLSKFQAQLAVFYGSCGIGGVLAYVVWHRLPAVLSACKASIIAKWQWLQIELLLAWEAASWRRKVQLLLPPLAGVGVSLFVLLA